MSICVKIRGKRRTICIGDLDKEIYLADRAITPPVFGSNDFTETFTANTDPTWAMLETVNGKTWFDGVETEEKITHKFYIVYDENITAEWWILFENKYIDILNVEDLEERHEWMLLTCTERGLVANQASHA